MLVPVLLITSPCVLFVATEAERKEKEEINYGSINSSCVADFVVSKLNPETQLAPLP
jgi:hypothetical protein